MIEIFVVKKFELRYFYSFISFYLLIYKINSVEILHESEPTILLTPQNYKEMVFLFVIRRNVNNKIIINV